MKRGIVMAYVVDVAMTLVNMSIEYAEESGDTRFLMNFVKMRELLYIAWHEFAMEYGNSMFSEKITKTEDGFHYINGTEFVVLQKGFGFIFKKFDSRFIVRPSYRRIQILTNVLKKYGRYNEHVLKAFSSIGIYDC